MFQKRKIAKELIGWVPAIALLVLLYFSGYRVQILGHIQGIMLKTGIFQPQVVSSENLDTNTTAKLALLTLDGARTSMNQANKVVFLNFWATWCAPCRAEMPQIQALFEKLDPNEFEFYMVSVDEQQQKVKEYINESGFTFPVYMTSGPRRVYIRATPSLPPSLSAKMERSFQKPLGWPVTIRIHSENSYLGCPWNLPNSKNEWGTSWPKE